MSPHVHPFLELIRGRSTVESFDPSRELDEDEIRALIEDAVSAPSSFNIQHWRFIAVRGTEQRRLLQAAAFGQEQVGQAPVTFIILGDLEGVERLPEIMDAAVESGAIAEGKAAAWVRMATKIYNDPQLARDEAMRSGALAAMILMLAAEARGLGSSALSGFDPERVRRDFRIAERYVPVMLLSVGHATTGSAPRMPRLTVDEVLSFDSGEDL